MVLVLDQFIRSLRDSRLIPVEELVSLEKALQGSKTPHTVEDVAKLLVQSGKLTEFQAAAISQGQPQRLILGEYVLINILGKGGMGVVYRARHRIMDRVVALKTLPPATIKPDSVQRFYREVKAAARLSHPNIVTAFDAGEHAGTHYLVMEYVVGRDLSAIVKQKGPLPLRQAIDYMQQAARGLAFAHAHGVVHRDVKPSNLLLNQEGVVKILDMGLARLSENLAGGPEAMELTGTGQILGTVDYMSPEQAEDVRSADQRSDIYSLGCTLFYLLTRRAAYGGETIVKRILAHRDEPIPSVMEIRPDCPERLDAAIRRMLAKRPEERPQSMAEVLVELEGCLAKPNAAPPLVAQRPDQSISAGNWLDDMPPDRAVPSTEDSQVQEATLSSGPAEDSPLPPPKTIAGGAATGRSQPQAHGAGPKEPAPTARGGITWKIIAAATTAALLAVATVTAFIFRLPGSDPAAGIDSAANPKASGALAQDDAKNSASGKPAPTPNRPQGSAWDEAWAETQGRADRLIAQRQYAKAIREYSTLAGRFRDAAAQQRCNEAIHHLQAEADTALQKVESTARQHLAQRQFVQARAALQPALATFGPLPAVARARKLLDEIDAAEKQAQSAAVKPPVTTAVLPALLKQRELNATFTAEMAAVERRVAVWDFQGAIRESENVNFDSPELTARLASRREQIGRMADLKGRIIDAINRANPHLMKADLMLRGINGAIDNADGEGITATLLNGRQESVTWSDLGPKATTNLLDYSVRRENAGDWLAAGLLSLKIQDAQTAEQDFDKARSLGADIATYQAVLAERELDAIRELLAKHKYPESVSLLAAVETKYGKIPWFKANQLELDAAAKEARRGLREKDAEALYAQAAGLLHSGDLYELKALVGQFEAKYADSDVAADPQRKPSWDELRKAVVDLGPLVRVRRDGKGDATTIQEAVAGAGRNAMIQIEDSGPWNEAIVVPAEKEGLTIRGKKGLLPVITASSGQSYAENLLVQSPQLSLERLVIVRADSGSLGAAITAGKAAVSLRGVVVYGQVLAGRLDAHESVCVAGVRAQQGTIARNCVFFGHASFGPASMLENVLVCNGGADCGAGSRLRHCTIVGPLRMLGLSSTITDSIVTAINTPNEGHTIEHCDIFGENANPNQATPGKGCIKALPPFVEAKTFDYRLQAGSPCRKAASDGSDMGFAYPFEIQALLKVATDLRNRGQGK